MTTAPTLICFVTTSRTSILQILYIFKEVEKQYQVINQRCKLGRNTLKDQMSLTGWPVSHPRSLRAAISCATWVGSQQPQCVPRNPTPSTDHEGRRDKTFSYSQFLSTWTYDGPIEDQQEIGGLTGACIVQRASRSKPKLENISLSMRVAANVRIMHQLSNTRKLSVHPRLQITFQNYTVKLAGLLESQTLAFVLLYNNRYHMLQHRYGFHWGRNSQHHYTG